MPNWGYITPGEHRGLNKPNDFVHIDRLSLNSMATPLLAIPHQWWRKIKNTQCDKGRLVFTMRASNPVLTFDSKEFFILVVAERMKQTVRTSMSHLNDLNSDAVRTSMSHLNVLFWSRSVRWLVKEEMERPCSAVDTYYQMLSDL